MILDLLSELAPRLAKVPLVYGSDPQAVAEELAASVWGRKAVESEPNLIDVAMLGLLGCHHLVVHQLHGAASRHAAVTDLHSLPDTPPALLRQPWLLEARHPDEGARLFGDTLSLSGDTLDGTMYLLGQLGDGRSVLASWQPRWTGEDLEVGPRRERSPVIDEGRTLPGRGRPRATPSSSVGQREAQEGLPVRTVYLSGPVAVPAVSPEAGSGWRGEVARQARGYLKRQRHGPWAFMSEGVTPAEAGRMSTSPPTHRTRSV